MKKILKMQLISPFIYDFSILSVSVILVLPGFVPAAELVVWAVPKGATFVVEAKVDKTIDAQSGCITWDGRKIVESGPTRGAQAGAPDDERPSREPDGRCPLGGKLRSFLRADQS